MAKNTKKTKKKPGKNYNSAQACRDRLVRMANITHAMLASPTRKIDEKQRDATVDMLNRTIDRIADMTCSRGDLQNLSQFLLNIHMMIRKGWAEDVDQKTANSGLVVTEVLDRFNRNERWAPSSAQIALIRECVSDFSEWACELTEREFSMLTVEGQVLLASHKKPLIVRNVKVLDLAAEAV